MTRRKTSSRSSRQIRRLWRVSLGGLLIAIAIGPAAARGVSDRLWYGGGIGLGFGDVDYVTLEPLVGISLNKRLSLGMGLIYRYRDDGRFTPAYTSNDYGANVFARYKLSRPFFLQGEYEYLSYEFVRFGGTKERDDYDSLLGGVGFSQPIGARTAAYVLAMYNFDYDETNSPYDEPWTFRAGISVGF